MRRIDERDGLRFQVVTGSHVALFGWTLREDLCDGLAGFAVHRTRRRDGRAQWMTGQKVFRETDPGDPPGTPHSTRDHPVQSFMWADYSAQPGETYLYRLVALKGPPRDLRPIAEAEVEITAESPEGAAHDVHFNRGVAASQMYARRFGNRPPDEVGQEAWDWLSRGLFEAMTAFVGAAGPGDGLRVAAYELHYPPVLERLAAARERGADVRIVMHAKDDAPDPDGRVFPRDANRAAVAAAGLADCVTERRAYKSGISHNKFIVRLRGGVPEAVWTGGTNFSAGGIFGQSNVAEAIDDPALAAQFLAYWDALAEDLGGAAMRRRVGDLNPPPAGPPAPGVAPVFSPRKGLDVLDWYAGQGRTARHALFMTFAFGMNPLFREVYRSSAAPLRFALMEKLTRPMKNGPEKDAEVAAIRALRRMDENLFAVGGGLTRGGLDGWLRERLSGLNSHVRFVHNKFMLVDPLSDTPLVIAGSANFSAASTEDNDENMLVISGNARVADIYLGEFMRLYSHHAFREAASRPRAEDAGHRFLRTDDWWRDYFGTGNRSRRRLYFSGSPFDL